MTLARALTLAFLGAMPAAALAQEEGLANTALVTADGAAAGTASFRALPAGLLIEVMLTNLSPGEHAIHVHQTGACAPDFDAAGEHLAHEGESHGFAATEAPHAGDLPNLTVADDGTATAQFLNPRLSLDDLTDEDGAALIIHAAPDDFGADPAVAGGRVACGVINAGT